MFKVTAIVSAANLAGFLAQTQGAHVEPFNGVGSGASNPPVRAHTEPATEAPAAATQAPQTAEAKRTRKPKDTPPPEDTPPPAGGHNRHNLVGGAAEEVDRDALLEKFTALVDVDYDKALDALTSFNVQRFSEIPDDKLAEFAKAIE